VGELLARASDAPTSAESREDSGIAVLDRAVAPMTGDLDAMRKLGRVACWSALAAQTFLSRKVARAALTATYGEYQRALVQQLKVRRGDMTVVFVPCRSTSSFPRCWKAAATSRRVD
jgi:hypothetical protein